MMIIIIKAIYNNKQKLKLKWRIIIKKDKTNRGNWKLWDTVQ